MSERHPQREGGREGEREKEKERKCAQERKIRRIGDVKENHFFHPS